VREEDLTGAVEAILFVSSEPVTVQQIVDALEGQCAPPQVMDILEGLQTLYARGSFGLEVRRVAEGFQLVTRPQHGTFVKNFLKAQNLRRLSPAAVETLAIVAYKQPVTNAEVSAIRGTECGQVLRNLLEKKLVRIAGRKDVVGKPLLYATTREFLVHFGLNSLDDLPSFRELEEIFREGVRQESLFKDLEEEERRRQREARAAEGPDEEESDGEDFESSDETPAVFGPAETPEPDTSAEDLESPPVEGEEPRDG
jgi:segregation and condensation protein B